MNKTGTAKDENLQGDSKIIDYLLARTLHLQ
jgi:hypothetical protein